MINWRASVASETLTQSKIGDVCLFIFIYTSSVLSTNGERALNNTIVK